MFFSCKFGIWIFRSSMQFAIWLCEDPDSEDATWCWGKISIHWLSWLCCQNLESRRTLQILHWIPCLLCQDCSSCHGTVILFPCLFLTFHLMVFSCLYTLLVPDDVDFPQPDSEIGKDLWVIVFYDDEDFVLEHKLWALNNLLAMLWSFFAIGNQCWSFF